MRTLAVVIGMIGGFSLPHAEDTSKMKPSRAGVTRAAFEEREMFARTHVGSYREWTKVNPKPVLVSQAFSQLCAAPKPPVPADPHQNSYVTVYVNEAGRSAMLTKSRPAFPIGTVIAKAKGHASDGSRVELMTVMEKRKAGPGDGWAYYVLNADGTKRIDNGDIANCRTCHAQMKRQDYVFRYPYLPTELARKLK